VRFSLFALCLLLSACKEKPKVAEPVSLTDSTKPYVYPNAEKAIEKAEVELFGKWNENEVKVASARFQVQAEPCLPLIEKPTVFGSKKLAAPGIFADEYFIPQGSSGHICLFGIGEDGKVNSAATFEKNPVVFQGSGEVVFKDLEMNLNPIVP
jgi:hypothetical protein